MKIRPKNEDKSRGHETESVFPVKIPLNRSPLIVVLDNIRSVYNVGSIFRTSDAAKISHLFLCGMTAYPPHPKIDKTALGAIPHVAWSHHVEAWDVVRELRGQGFPIWACETGNDSQDYLEPVYSKPLVLVFGHEVMGINPQILAMADKQLEIPMSGHKSSLNVATAYGIILFEALRQFRSLPGSP